MQIINKRQYTPNAENYPDPSTVYDFIIVGFRCIWKKHNACQIDGLIQQN